MITKNNGGDTDYYTVPEGAKTLNDLIEFKKMPFWLANIFKACYRFNANDAKKKVYDINKMSYYANRGLKLVLEKDMMNDKN